MLAEGVHAVAMLDVATVATELLSAVTVGALCPNSLSPHGGPFHRLGGRNPEWETLHPGWSLDKASILHSHSLLILSCHLTP